MNTNYPLFLPNVTRTFANFESVLTDSNVRLKESREALFAIIDKNYFKEIVIVDGSENKILSEEEIQEFLFKGIKIEQLIFLQDKDLVEKYGKGHGEMQITNYMVQHSELVRNAGGFVKLTPRYFFDNIDDILPVINQFSNVFFFYYPSPLRKMKTYMMSIFYKTSLDFYKKNIEDSIQFHNKDVSGYMESVLYKQLMNVDKKPISVSYPHFSGTSGTTGKSIRNQYVLFRNICSKLGMMAYSFK
ncbi:hypothetical protein [Chryseobacterium scophthalmum]|uniref:hypothetical protein n=1 Tax=Chryseobacterium scophthalmum TaxID=59733 RepID=UPI001AEBAE3F|nr:hypothetical protein [Chryseobacterium scophthalmum]